MKTIFAAVVLALSFGVGPSRADVPQLCERPGMVKALYHDINAIPALQKAGVQAVDLLDVKTLSVDGSKDSFACAATVKWSDSTSQRIRISVSKNSMDESVIAIQEYDGKP